MKNQTLPFFTLLLFLCFNVFADDAPGPHGGKIVQNDTNKFEVKIDRDAKKVEVYTLHSVEKKLTPKTMTITLFRDADTGQTIDLKAVDLKDPLPKYQGELSPYGGSYVGAELRFGISLKSLQILKFIPNNAKMK